MEKLRKPLHVYSFCVRTIASTTGIQQFTIMQRARFAKVGADRAVGGIELGVDHRSLTAEPAPIRAIFAVALDRENGIDAVRLAQVEIILAMIGRHMDEPGAAVGGDEIAGEEGARAREEIAECVHRVAGDGALERPTAFEVGINGIAVIPLRTDPLKESRHKFGSYQKPLADEIGQGWLIERTGLQFE